jgi:hypothetical protein
MTLNRWLVLPITRSVYVVAVEGEKEQVLDLAGVYRLVALVNPMDGRPMAIDSKTVVTQMTVPKDDCVMPKSTRDALHALVWGAVSGEVTTYRFLDGPAMALTVQPGDEYKPPPKEYGEVKAPSDGRYRERRFGGR